MTRHQQFADAMFGIVISTYEERWLAAMRLLPALPRTLFRLSNFYNVEPMAMANALDTDMGSVTLCLAEARSMLGTCAFLQPPDRFPADGTGLRIAELERSLRQQYRRSCEITLAESGYAGIIAWPDPIAAIEADEEAAAAVVVSALPKALRQAVYRSCRLGIATVDLQRHVSPWRRSLRRSLGWVQLEIRYAGWQPFDEWLADRIASDRCYPHGYRTVLVRRRPLPDEQPGMVEPDLEDPPTKAQIEMQARFDRLPALTQRAFILFRRYGRTDAEIARTLSLTQRSVTRRIQRALFAICDWPAPSPALSLLFELCSRLQVLPRWFRTVRAALYR